MFEKEIELRALLCGKETQFCHNSQALRPDIMWCVANCSIMSKILAIYAAGREDERKIEEKEAPKVVYFCKDCGKEITEEEYEEQEGRCIGCWEYYYIRFYI